MLPKLFCQPATDWASVNRKHWWEAGGQKEEATFSPHSLSASVVSSMTTTPSSGKSSMFHTVNSPLGCFLSPYH